MHKPSNKKMAARAYLPPELWEEIGKRLPGRIDVANFRSVCKEWRSALPRPTRFPLRIPAPPGAPDPNSTYRIAEVQTYCIDGSHYINLEAKAEARRFRIAPSRTRIPPLGLEVGHFRRPSCLEKSHRIYSEAAAPAAFLSKVVLIRSGGNGGVSGEYSRLSDLSVVAHLSGGELALLRLGDNSEWDTSFCRGRFYDIARYRGQLCAVDLKFRVFLMDYHSLRMTRVSHRIYDDPEILQQEGLEFDMVDVNWISLSMIYLENHPLREHGAL